MGDVLTLVRVQSDDVLAIEEVSHLHAVLLPFGPLARLGERFLRDFCYTFLVHDRLLDVVLCRVGLEPAGFVAYTPRSITFHRDALRRHSVRAGWIALSSVIRETDRVPRLAEAAQLLFSRRAEDRSATDPLAEVVAIAVRPEFTHPSFVRRTGRRVSELLLQHCADEFRRQGLPRMRVVVDADNRAALLFYQTLGGEFQPYTRGGRPSTQVWFDLTGDLLRTDSSSNGLSPRAPA